MGLATSFRLTDLIRGTTYYFGLTAYDTKGLESGFSAELVGTVPLLPSNMPPTLIIQGDSDKLVPLYQAESFVKKCQEVKAPVKLIVREGKDKAFVIHFDREVELLQDLTSSLDKLENALGDLETPRLSRASGSGSSGPSGGGHHGGFGGGGTLLYDAVFLAADEVTSKQEGRKALIVLSDGVDVGSKETLDYAVETAQRADTVVYSILFKDDEGYQSGFGGSGMGGGVGGMGRRGGRRFPQQERPDGKKILERIAKETGGRLFEVSKKQSIEEIYTRIEEELRHQYSLGYTPATPTAGYHKIQLTAKQKDLVVQTRDGYYAGR